MISATAKIGTDVKLYPNVFIGSNVSVGDNTILFPGVVILNGSVIGKDCIIYPNVTIYSNTVMGDRVIVGSSSVIGSDGFGFIEKDGKRIKIPHVGRVTIGDDVEIGSNTSIDRGTVGETRIGNGTKVDNLVQIAHNCSVGDDCILCGMVGLSGTTVVGNRVIMAANSGTKGHMSIGDDCIVTGRTSVTKDLEKGSQVKGYPARPLAEELKIQTLVGKLPELYKLLKKIEKRMNKEQ
jgi:UDP-3-O-[3-hydroxymyristoyl] glucosamine N-acyltransferase